MEGLIRDIWKKKATEAGFAPELVQAYGEKFSAAITKGYGKDLFNIDFNTPDYNKLKSLHIDAWKFASAKANTQMNELSKALVKPDGTMRTFEEFRIQSVIITGKHLSGLKAEYNTAVASAQMASKWETIQEQKEIFPYLQFVAVEDNHTTALCRSLDGVTRHVDDPFWEKYYPPNHYNCRSTVKQLRKAPEGQEGGAYSSPNFPEEFEVNLAKQGKVFPQDHNYFKQTSEEVMLNYRASYPYLLQFDRVDIEGDIKGLVNRHFLVDETASDYSRVLELATEKARKGNVVDILPTLDPMKYPDSRRIIFHDAKPNKSADLRINGVLSEEEGVFKHSRRAIKGAIEAGANQANFIYVTLPDDMIINFELRDIVRLKFNDYPDLKEVVFRYRGREIVYKKGEADKR